MHRYTRKTKRQLAQQVVELEAQLQKERRERNAMEEALPEAYSATLREMVAMQESASTSRPAPSSRGGRGNLRDKLNFR